MSSHANAVRRVFAGSVFLDSAVLVGPAGRPAPRPSSPEPGSIPGIEDDEMTDRKTDRKRIPSNAAAGASLSAQATEGCHQPKQPSSAGPDRVRGGFAKDTTTIVEAMHTTTCVGCGRVLQAGDWQQALHGRAAHAICAVFAQGPSKGERTGDAPAVGDGASTTPAGPKLTPAGAGQASVQYTCGDKGAAAEHRGTEHCPKAYPNHIELLTPRALAPGACLFDVRFPGWTTDVTATSLTDAAWAAEEAVREHAPSETAEVRCAQRQRCDHPAEWIPIPLLS